MNITTLKRIFHLNTSSKILFHCFLLSIRLFLKFLRPYFFFTPWCSRTFFVQIDRVTNRHPLSYGSIPCFCTFYCTLFWIFTAFFTAFFTVFFTAFCVLLRIFWIFFYEIVHRRTMVRVTIELFYGIFFFLFPIFWLYYFRI